VLAAHPFRRLLARLGVVICVGVLVKLMLDLGAHVDLVIKAAGIPKNSSGLGGFVNGAQLGSVTALID
jgi:hypothetical protein